MVEVGGFSETDSTDGNGLRDGTRLGCVAGWVGVEGGARLKGIKKPA